MTYQPKVYRKQGGDEMVVANGGILRIESGGQFISPNNSGAADYFVDLNVSASGDGSSWDEAFATIAEAITASNASIGLAANRWWARRNRIFVCGDGIAENLTVMPEKCDIIGVGSDLYPFPRVIGHHVIAAAAVGWRSINMGWQNDDTGPLWTIPASSHGFQFVGGILMPKTGGSTKALMITDSACWKVSGVKIDVSGGSMSHIFAQGITVEGTIGHEAEIVDSVIVATEGIDVASGIAGQGSIIHKNTIRATTGMPIDENSDDFMVVDNRMMTEIDIGTTTAGYDFNLALASGNILTGLNGVAATVPFAVTTE